LQCLYDIQGAGSARTIALRIAVHFCPALDVISRTLRRHEQVEFSGVPGPGNRAEIEELSEIPSPR